jgi:hypothetical protein
MQLTYKAVLILWLSLTFLGTVGLWLYTTTPGKDGSPPDRWPASSNLRRTLRTSTLMMFFIPSVPVRGPTSAKGPGLAICQRLVELIKGKIGLESELSRGSSFWCTAQLKHPVASDQPEATARVPSPDGPYSPRCEALKRGMSRAGTVGRKAICDARPRFALSKASIVGLSRGSNFRIRSHIVV